MYWNKPRTTHLIVEALRDAGFVPEVLIHNRMFKELFHEWWSYRMSWEDLLENCEKIAIFNPKVKA